DHRARVRRESRVALHLPVRCAADALDDAGPGRRKFSYLHRRASADARRVLQERPSHMNTTCRSLPSSLRSLGAGSALVMTIAGMSASAQAPDTLRLADLQAAALRRDPRDVQASLLEQQSRLRAQNILADRHPTLTVEGVAQYQSDVTRF